jgi:hypothetical protein
MACLPEDILGVPADVDTLDEQLDDARLLGRQEIVSHRIEPLQSLADVGFLRSSFDCRAARQVRTITPGERSRPHN